MSPRDRERSDVRSYDDESNNNMQTLFANDFKYLERGSLVSGKL